MTKLGAVAILSGGIDSATALAMVREKGVYRIDHAVWFKYGQRHEVERMYAERLAAHYDLAFHIIEIPRVFGDNQLTNPRAEPRMDTPMREITKGVAPTFVPGRNMVMLALAASHAVSLEMDAVVGGWHWDDSSGYPDCRASFIESMQGSINEAMGMQHFSIQAPLISLSKNQIIDNAIRLGVPADRTWSCYNPQPMDPIVQFYWYSSMPTPADFRTGKPIELLSCGRCDTCQLRIKGFKDAGFIDPIPYAIEIDWAGCEPIGGWVS